MMQDWVLVREEEGTWSIMMADGQLIQGLEAAAAHQLVAAHNRRVGGLVEEIGGWYLLLVVAIAQPGQLTLATIGAPAAALVERLAQNVAQLAQASAQIATDPDGAQRQLQTAIEDLRQALALPELVREVTAG